MWKPAKEDDTIRVKVMGALAVGKTTMVTTAVTRTAPKRTMPYSRTRQNQRFLCSVKSPSGSLVVAELFDTRGNEGVDSSSHEGRGRSMSEERTNLLDKGDPNTRWCYLIVFDFTRLETYLQARRLIDGIRRQEMAQAYSKMRRAPQAPIFLVGNKREMCAAATVAGCVMDMRKLADSREGYCFIFGGSAIENSYESLDITKEKRMILEDALELSRTSSPQIDLASVRLTIDQLIHLFHANLERGRHDHQRLRSLDVAPGPPHDDNQSMVSDGDDDRLDEDETVCQRCCSRCRPWGKSRSARKSNSTIGSKSG